jgi:hypothetical protein
MNFKKRFRIFKYFSPILLHVNVFKFIFQKYEDVVDLMLS